MLVQIEHYIATITLVERLQWDIPEGALNEIGVTRADGRGGASISVRNISGTFPGATQIVRR